MRPRGLPGGGGAGPAGGCLGLKRGARGGPDGGPHSSGPLAPEGFGGGPRNSRRDGSAAGRTEVEAFALRRIGGVRAQDEELLLVLRRGGPLPPPSPPPTPTGLKPKS